VNTQIFQLPAFDDNYIFILRSGGSTVVVDPGDAAIVASFLEKQNWTLDEIWITHHHLDHIGGVGELVQKFGAKVRGSVYDQHRLPKLDVTHSDNDHFVWNGLGVEVLFLPGHTSGHIAYLLADSKWLLSGDVIFALGCGRLFEGSASQMHESLSRIMRLSDDIEIFCTHEYTESNAQFALNVEPGNVALQHRIEEIKTLRKQGLPTIPTSIDLEKQTNPFVRLQSQEIREQLELEVASDLEVFTALRKLKDVF
jgi:hydroxyacylglutathione hydrolase